MLLLCLLLIIPTAALAVEGDLPVLEKPVNLGVRNDRDITVILRLPQPDSIMSLSHEYSIAC